MSRFSEWRARRKADGATLVTKDGAKKQKRKRKLFGSPLKAYKKATANSSLLKQLQGLATSGSLGGVLSAAGVGIAGVAAVGAVATVAAAVGFDIGPLAQDETIAVEAERAIIENDRQDQQQDNAIATVEARLDDTPTNADLDQVREDFDTRIEDVIAETVARIDESNDPLRERITAADASIGDVAIEVAAIDVEQISENAAAVETVIAAVVEADTQRAELTSVLDTVASTAIEALGVATLARDEAQVAQADAALANGAAEVARSALAQSSSQVLDAQTELARITADQTATQAQVEAAQAEVVVAQIAADEAQAAADAADARAAAAESEAQAATANQIITSAALVDLGETLADTQGALTDTAALANQTATTAEELQDGAAAADAERVANQAAAAQAQAEAALAQLSADSAEVAANAAQADATEALAFPLTAGPAARRDISPHVWQAAGTPIAIPESGVYEITMIATYASGSGNAVFQSLWIDGVKGPETKHANYDIFVTSNYSATFIWGLSAGQTIDQSILHNSAGATGWTPGVITAERIG